MLNRIFLLSFFLLSGVAAAATSSAKSLWKDWYLVTVDGQVEGYYMEEAEKRDLENQLSIAQRWMERGDMGLTETYIGSVAKNDGAFTPIAFFVEKKSASQAYTVDGRVKDGGVLVQEKGEGKGQKQKLGLEKGVVWSNFLGPLLAKSKKWPLHFQSIVEDAPDSTYLAQDGEAIATSEHKQIHQSRCRKYSLVFRGIQSEWWVAENGKLCKMQVSSRNTKVSLSSEKEAKAAFQRKSD